MTKENRGRPRRKKIPQMGTTAHGVDKDMMIEENTYRRKTLKLFVEYDPAVAMYSLRNDDVVYEGKTYPSLKKFYLKEGDITEYQFANKYLLDWQHWQQICNNNALRSHIDGWREELELLFRHKAIQQTMASAAKGNFNAQKWLAEAGWREKKPGKASKAEREAIAQKERKLAEVIEADFDRIRLVK